MRLHLKRKFELIGVGLLFLFSSCSIWPTAESVIDKKDYEKMIHGKLETITDVVNLVPKNINDITKRVELAIKRAESDLNKILSIKDEDRTFENTARALDHAEAAFSIVRSGIHFVELIHPEKAMCDAAHEASLRLKDFAIDTFLQVDLYNAFKSYVDGNAKNETLNDEEYYFLQDAMREFLHAGLHLPEEKLKIVKSLQKEIGQLSSEFARNIALDQSAIFVNKEDLAGISNHFVDSLKQDDSGKYIVRCDYPTVSEVMKHCSVASTRKALRTTYLNRAYPANKKLLEDIIAKRDELAKMLGFSSYAHFDLDNQMAKQPEKAGSFIKDLALKVKGKEQEEFDRLIKDLPEGVSLDNGKLHSWDVGYVKENYKKKYFNLDDRDVAKYFTMEKTIEGIFSIYQKFLGLRFALVKPEGLWHEDASIIEVYREGVDVPEGYIFLDLHPRDNKYSHACCAELVSSVYDKEGKINGPSVAAVVANFPKSTKDRPSLLKHGDVETFFHEFGHAMHQILGRTEMFSFAGFETKIDFVEVPSQMFEEWMWDKKMLQQVTSHYKTGEALPDELIDKMIELKRFDSGYFIQRQCFLSLLSLAYFNESKNKDLDEMYKKLYEECIPHIVYDADAHMYASFGHLTGYGAKYYSYMWSKVFALDLFDYIRKRGLLNKEVGQAFIDKVIGKGGSVDPEFLLEDFLGRKPNQDAFLKDIGVSV